MDTHDVQRIERGMRWGALATVLSGVVVLGMTALHLWPSGRPLSVQVVELIGGQYLGRQGAPVATWLLAGAMQLSWGALCGGFLAVIVDRVNLTNALGFGALRWFWTQVMIAPALGWGDFGLLGLPAVSLATLLPHLVYALSLGWLMRQEDEGRAPLPIHLHWPHLHWKPLAARGRRRS